MDLTLLWTQMTEIGQAMFGVAKSLFMLGIMFFLLVEVLKRLPGAENRHNFRLAHTERPFFNRDFFTELAFPIVGVLFILPLSKLLDYFSLEILNRNLPFQLFSGEISSWPMWLQVIAGLVLLDFSLYVRHRFVHAYFWPYHTVHHSAQEITWLTWIRLHPLDQFVMQCVNLVIMHVIGFGGEAFAMASLITEHFNRFNHSNIQLDYPSPLRYILASPNMHRWHHAADDPEALNKNFCIVFAWIDLLFGTFYVPKNRLPGRYGVLDEHGNDVAGPRYWQQIVYPFQHHWRWVRRHVRRGEPEASAAPAAANANQPD